MDTREEEFALMRRSFLRAALQEAEASGGPSSRVRLRGVAEALGVDFSGEAGPVLGLRYAEMAGHYRDTGDLSDLEGEGGGGAVQADRDGYRRGQGGEVVWATPATS